MEVGWINVTDELFTLSKKLGFMETVLHPDVDLEQTMHAHEINDPKIDPKWDLQQGYTISKMVEKGQVRPYSSLTIPDIRNIYAHVLRLQGLILQTQPLQQTIYTFSYLYDEKLWRESIVMEALVESINSLGMYIYELHKTSCSLKEDDLNISTFAFRKIVKSHDEVSELFLKAEKDIDQRMKAEKDEKIQTHGKELISHIKFRRALHLFVKVLGSTYSSKNQSKIQGQIKTFRKRLHQLSALIQKNQFEDEIPNRIFNQLLPKTLRSNFGFKTIKPITTTQAFGQINNMLQQLELFLPPPTKISDYQHRLDILSYRRINLLSKSYLKANFFAKEGYLVGTVRTEQALVNDLKEYNTISAETRQNEKFANLITLSAPTMADSLYKQLGRNARWFWQVSKVYDDVNVLIHLCNELDSVVQERKKDAFMASWYYNFATKKMIRQVLWGFEEDLYEQSEYHYVAYQLEYILHINEKNNHYFSNKIDNIILESFYNKTLNKKQKKHLSEAERRFLADSIFLKGLHYYFRSFYRLLVVLISRGFINDPFKASQQLRINNRFRIFKNVMFMKKVNCQSFEKEVQMILSDEGKILDEATQLLKAAKNIFGLFSQFEENETYYRQVEDASILEKMSVKLSLVVMALKFKQNKKFSIKKECPRYPEIQMQ